MFGLKMAVHSNNLSCFAETRPQMRRVVRTRVMPHPSDSARRHRRIFEPRQILPQPPQTTKTTHSAISLLFPTKTLAINPMNRPFSYPLDTTHDQPCWSAIHCLSGFTTVVSLAEISLMARMQWEMYGEQG